MAASSCDLGGWVASGYMRGLPYVNLPTTLLAQVDGALGGKTAVNHELAKNLLGAFHQPAAVISNIGYLATNSRRHIAAGAAEVIKKAMIASPECWTLLEDSAERLVGHDAGALLERSCGPRARSRRRSSRRDPYERDLRRPLNFGHTIGHPLETVTGYGPLLHGEAVAFGMVVESRIAVARGLLDPCLLERLLALLERFGLPARAADLPVAVDGRGADGGDGEGAADPGREPALRAAALARGDRDRGHGRRRRDPARAALERHRGCGAGDVVI